MPIKKKGAGGARPGSGRPKLSGKYREVTQPVRLPQSLLPYVKSLLEQHKENLKTQTCVPEYLSDGVFLPEAQSRYHIPLYGHRVPAGQPLQVEDFIEEKLDLNQYLVKHPQTTFLVRVQGDSMINAGIDSNDLLVVDRSLKASSGKIVIAVVNSELTVKRLHIGKEEAWELRPENENYIPIVITADMSFEILGVVTHVLHSV